MDVAVIIVGINQWEEYTLPFVKSIEKYEPKVKICVVDNGSDPMYPRFGVRIEKTLGYAAAINAGLSMVYADWYVIANNDVLCEGPFVKHLKKLDKNALYGNQLNGNMWVPRYIEGWIFFVSRQVLNKVGEFDEKFDITTFDDVDYSYRATKLGIPLLKLDMPFNHFGGKTRYDMPGYKEARKRNQEYFKKKHGFDIERTSE